MRYEVISYDVWGNEEDGFTVNQSFHTGRYVDIPEDATDAQFVAVLVEAGELNERANASNVRVDGEPDYSLYLEDAETGEPLFELRAER